MSTGKRRHLGALLLYLVLTVVMTWPMAAQATTAIPGDGFDGWQNAWNLWWLREALVTRVQWPLFTDLLYFPTGVSLHFHTLNPFNGLVTLPVQLSMGLLPAYNAVVLLSFTLSGYGAFLLASWVLRPSAAESRPPTAVGWWAAVLAGAIFAYAPVHMAQLLGHMQVFAYQWIPFAALYILRALQRSDSGKRWLRESFLAGLFVTFAALCDWYFALYLLLFTGLALVWTVLRGLVRERSFKPLLRPVMAVLAVGATAAVLLSPLLAPMTREALRADYMVRPARDLFIYSASALDFVIPSRMHPVLRDSGMVLPGSQVAPISERTIAVGWLVIALATAGLVLRWRRSLPWLLAGFFFALLALGPRPTLGNITWEQIPDEPLLTDWSLYNLVNAVVPFMRISRSVSRFAIMVQMSLGVAAAIGFAALLGRRPKWSAPAAIAAMAILVAEFWVVPYPMSAPDTPEYYRTLAVEPVDAARPAVLNLPMNYDRPGYLLYQAEHGRPLTVAYISRDDPRTLTERVPVLQHLRHLGPDIIEAEISRVGATVLQDLGVGVVVLDRYKMPGGRERDYTEEVAAALFAGESPVFEDERLTVFLPSAPAEATPYLRLSAEGWAPLQERGGERMRQLRAGGAGIEVVHGVGDESVLIQYRSDGAVAVEGDAVLPPAPEGNVAIVDLRGRSGLWLAPLASEVWIERLALQGDVPPE